LPEKIEKELREKLFPSSRKNRQPKKVEVKSTDSRITEPVGGEKAELF
jgi:hypothetical protein